MVKPKAIFNFVERANALYGPPSLLEERINELKKAELKKPKRESRHKDILATIDQKDFTQWMYDQLVAENIINPDDLLDYPAQRDWDLMSPTEFKRCIGQYKAERGYD